jgi:hypothetical protein
MNAKFNPPVLFGFGNYDSAVLSDASGLCCTEPSLAVQEAALECDINIIVKRFGITGELPQGVRAPTYGDFTGVSDYHSALIALSDADDAFMLLPADIRSRFNHDAGAFVDFCSDAANRDEMIKMGLVISPKVSDPALALDSANTEVKL